MEYFAPLQASDVELTAVRGYEVELIEGLQWGSINVIHLADE